MAERTRLPQIPSTVWWGVHSILNKTPTVTLDDRYLANHLSVQPVAAKQYISELVAVGILSEEFKATPLAMKWRLSNTYPEAVAELVSKVYPQSLIDIAPPGSGDRQRAINWFLQEGLGKGAATNKAATYLMISSGTPNEAPSRARTSGTESKQTSGSNGDVKPSASTKSAQKRPPKAQAPSHRGGSGTRADGIPLNVNVQIHISADAGSDQIESIFSAMRRYLYDQQNS